MMKNTAAVKHKMPQKNKIAITTATPRDIEAFSIDSLPDRYKEDIQKSVEILKKEGCKEIYLFGSLVTGKYHDKSDIDIGIKGLPSEKFFDVYAKLGYIIELTDFDDSKDFFEIVNRHKEIVKIG
jgi:predicted nucleotidyltransferase